MNQNQAAIVVALITKEKGEVLLGKRNEPYLPELHEKWEFPGGHIDFGEDAETALVREVKEETGLDVKIIRLLPKIYSNIWKIKNKDCQAILIAFHCEAIGGILKSDNVEISELKYFKPEDINYQNCLPKTKEIIDLLKF